MLRDRIDLRCYSQRLLNPFRGVMNVIRYQSAEAVTTDGIHWEIYVSNDALLEGLDTSSRVQTSDIRYGSWNARDGLHRGPIYPSEDFRRLEAMGATVYEALLEYHQDVPFPLTDIYELWLLDSNEQPLALLHSVCQEHEIETDIPLQWRAGNRCQKTFYPDLDLDRTHDMTPADVLMQHVHHCAGLPLKARWYVRDVEGHATSLTGINVSDNRERVLHAEMFSPFFVNADPRNSAFVKLLNAFIDWQAPWLLLLPNLSAEQRTHFEKQARRHALMVEAQYRLYPEIIDVDQIKGARVEAMLRKSNPVREKDETLIPPWYLEYGEDERGK